MSDNLNSTQATSGHLKSRGQSLMTRILLILVAGSIALCAIIAFTVSTINSRSLTNYAKNLVNGSYNQLLAVMNREKESLKNNVARMFDSRTFISLVNEGDVAAVKNYLDTVGKECDADAVYVLNSNSRARFSSSGSPVWESGDFDKSDFFKNASTEATAGMLLFGREIKMSAIKLAGTDAVGNKYFVLFTKNVSTDEQSDYYAIVTGCDFGMFLDDVCIATSLIGADGVRQVGTREENADAIYTVYERGENYVNHSVIAGFDFMTIYAPFKLENSKTNSMVVLGMRTDDVYKMMHDLMLYSVITIIIACVIFAIVILVFFSGVVIQPLRAAAWAIHELADDTQDADLTYRIPVKGNTEISRLSADINTFLERQQDLVIDLQSAQTVLKEIGSNMKLVAQDSASAITEITANIDSIRNHADNQVRSLKNTANEMGRAHELEVAFDGKIESQTASIVESSASIEKMVQNIASVSASVQKMNNSFRELSDVTKNGEERQEQVDIQVTAMSEQSKLLVEANSVISRIASQTNLLAMNAAIEAAHAGEAGAGFSVVADEIRALAETSAKQTRIINQQLKEIAATISEVVNASELSKNAFGIIIERLSQTGSLMREIDRAMGEQDNASKQVLKALHDMNDGSSEVQIMSKNLRRSNERVMEEMGKLEHIVQTVSGSMDEMNAGAQQIGKSAHTVSDMAAETDENIRLMAGLVSRFRV